MKKTNWWPNKSAKSWIKFLPILWSLFECSWSKSCWNQLRCLWQKKGKLLIRKRRKLSFLIALSTLATLNVWRIKWNRFMLRQKNKGKNEKNNGSIWQREADSGQQPRFVTIKPIRLTPKLRECIVWIFSKINLKKCLTRDGKNSRMLRVFGSNKGR